MVKERGYTEMQRENEFARLIAASTIDKNQLLTALRASCNTGGMIPSPSSSFIFIFFIFFNKK